MIFQAQAVASWSLRFDPCAWRLVVMLRWVVPVHTFTRFLYTKSWQAQIYFPTGLGSANAI